MKFILTSENWYETQWPHGETQVREVWVLDFWLGSLAIY